MDTVKSIESNAGKLDLEEIGIETDEEVNVDINFSNVEQFKNSN